MKIETHLKNEITEKAFKERWPHGPKEKNMNQIIYFFFFFALVFFFAAGFFFTAFFLAFDFAFFFAAMNLTPLLLKDCLAQSTKAVTRSF